MAVPTFPLSDGTQIPSLAWGNVSIEYLHFIARMMVTTTGRRAGSGVRRRWCICGPACGWGEERTRTDLPWSSSQGTGDAKKTATESGQLAIKVGIRHIDTAQGYENEKETGESISIAAKDNGIKPDEIYLTTKRASPSCFPCRSHRSHRDEPVSTEQGDPNKPGISLEDLRDSVRGSLERLGRQPNLILIHNPFVAPKGKLVEFWKILEDMKDKGELTASLGVSNFRPQVRSAGLVSLLFWLTLLHTGL